MSSLAGRRTLILPPTSPNLDGGQKDTSTSTLFFLKQKKKEYVMHRRGVEPRTRHKCYASPKSYNVWRRVPDTTRALFSVLHSDRLRLIIVLVKWIEP
jgi:hypothetical protein